MPTLLLLLVALAGRIEDGQLAPDVIHRVVVAHMSEIKQCYMHGLTKHPDLAGKVTTKFVIGTSGAVRSAVAVPESTTMPDHDVVACVVGRVRALQFPAPEGGEVTVTYPFVFASAN